MIVSLLLELMYVNLYCKVPVPSFASQFSFIFSPALALAGTEKDVILILDKIVIKEQRCAIIVKGENYGEEIRNQRRRIE